MVDDRLWETLGDADTGERVRAILTYDERRTDAQVRNVERTGVDVHRFDVLPMHGVGGTKRQVELLLNLSAPVSVYADRELDYLLHESVRTIGANRVRSGLGPMAAGSGWPSSTRGGRHEQGRPLPRPAGAERQDSRRRFLYG